MSRLFSQLRDLQVADVRLTHAAQPLLRVQPVRPRPPPLREESCRPSPCCCPLYARSLLILSLLTLLHCLLLLLSHPAMLARAPPRSYHAQTARTRRPSDKARQGDRCLQTAPRLVLLPPASTRRGASPTWRPTSRASSRATRLSMAPRPLSRVTRHESRTVPRSTAHTSLAP